MVWQWKNRVNIFLAYIVHWKFWVQLFFFSSVCKCSGFCMIWILIFLKLDLLVNLLFLITHSFQHFMSVLVSCLVVLIFCFAIPHLLKCFRHSCEWSTKPLTVTGPNCAMVGSVSTHPLSFHFGAEFCSKTVLPYSGHGNGVYESLIHTPFYVPWWSGWTWIIDVLKWEAEEDIRVTCLTCITPWNLLHCWIQCR